MLDQERGRFQCFLFSFISELSEYIRLYAQQPDQGGGG